MFVIEEELKKLPDQPGVYIMHDSRDAIIYIGKAVSLRKRVHQYFQPSHDEGIKKAQMIKQIARFEYIVTDSELEALVLECNLIKEHRPKYNTMLRDDKTYPYIRVTLGEDFPRVLFSRQQKKDKSRYFGPYTSAGAVKDTIELLNKLFKLRTCNRVLPRDCGLERPCLNYHIGQCMAPCQDYVSREEYRAHVDKALEFLNGNYNMILNDLQKKMEEAAEALEFEEAARYRDLFNSVKQVSQKQKITDSDGEDKDIIALDKDGSDAVVQVFFVRGGKLIGREHFYMTHVEDSDKAQILLDFVKQFYAGTPFVPRELILQKEIDDIPVLEEWLTARRGARVYIRVPRKGQKEKLVELAEKNAKLVLEKDRERIARDEARTVGAVRQIAQLLDLPMLDRMEAFDISNISGFENVGSMVVYEKGKPKRSDYRKFRIKTVAGPDDYACMREVLTRRFEHGLKETKELEEKNLSGEFGSFARFPDLLLMDGGRGQVSAAKEALAGTALADVPLYGMVKDDHHRTRAIVDSDGREIAINMNRGTFTFITAIQDETHRFANAYRKQQMKQKSYSSTLTEVPGVGPKTAKALLTQFKSVGAVKEATPDQLENTPGVGKQLAQTIYEYFHREA